MCEIFQKPNFIEILPTSVVDPNTLNLDPDPGFRLNLDPDPRPGPDPGPGPDPDPGLYYQF